MAKKVEKKKGLEDDMSIYELQKNYTNKCSENGKIPKLASFKKMLDKGEVEGPDALDTVKKLHLFIFKLKLILMVENDSDFIGPVCVRAIMDAMSETRN